MRGDTSQTQSIIRLLTVLAAGAAAAPAWAQVSAQPRVLGGGGGVVVVPNDPLLNPDSPEARAYAALQLERRKIERELRILKRKYFGTIRSTERREIGLRKLREYTSPPAILAMTELFDKEQEDVRFAILDHFSTLEPKVAQPTLAWEAVHGQDEWYRQEARKLLARAIEINRIETNAESSDQSGETSAMPAIRSIIADGLRSQHDTDAIAASRLVSSLKLFEFIPLMATAQVAPQGGGGNNRTGDLGWIMIGRQQSYVADLQAIVSNNAVAFDPQIGVASDGVLLRIHDAVVIVYRTEVYRTLVDMTTDAWGRPTQSLGYDSGAWQDWYTDEFLPHIAQQAIASEVAPEQNTTDEPGIP